MKHQIFFFLVFVYLLNGIYVLTLYILRYFVSRIKQDLNKMNILREENNILSFQSDEDVWAKNIPYSDNLIWRGPNSLV